MRFKAKKKTERSALDNHKDWVIVTRSAGQVLIRCMCCHPAEKKSDLRWVDLDQLED